MKYKTTAFILLFLMFQLQSIDVHANYVNGKIFFADGKETKCMVKLPIRSYSKKITVKDKPNSKPRTIKSDDLDMIVLSSNQENILLKRSQFISIKPKGGTKITDDKYWFQVKHYCENIVSYIGIEGYEVNNSGQLLIMTTLGIAGHYLQRPGETAPTMVGKVSVLGDPSMASGYNMIRKNKLATYFANDKNALNEFSSSKQVTPTEIFDYIESICEEEEEEEEIS